METAYHIMNHYLSVTHWLMLAAVFAASFSVSLVIAKTRGILLQREIYVHAIFISLLIAYIFFVLLITLISRTPAAEHKAEWIPLWSWYEVVFHKDKELLAEIILNVLLFVPVGCLLRLLHPFHLLSSFCLMRICSLLTLKPRKVFLLGFVFSAVIETIQLVTCRGLFEWDDMIGNGLGCMLGYCLGRYAKDTE